MLPTVNSVPWPAGRRVPSSRLMFWIGGLFLLCCVVFPYATREWYQDSRLDTTLALVNHGTLAIDAYHRDTQDKTFYDGHYYSITAPGLSLTGVPVAWLFERIVGTRGLMDVDASGHTSYQFFMLRYVETLLTVSLPAAFLLGLFFWFLGFLSDSLLNRAAATLALGLATNLFPYGQVFVAHAPAAAMLFTAFALLFVLADPLRATPRTPAWISNHRNLAAALSGLLLGLSILYEYQTAVAVALIGLYAAIRLPRRVLLVVAAAVPPALVVLLCNHLMYHGFFATGYGQHSVLWRHQFQNGVAGMSWPPSPAALVGMSVSPFRGLFFLSPFLVLSLIGLGFWLRRRSLEAALCLAIPVCYFLAIAMIPFWQAGSTVGPRYLIPSLPFLGAPLVLVLDRLPRLWPVFGLAAGFSLFNVWAQTLGGEGYPLQDFANPLMQYSLPAILHGTIRANLGSLAMAPFGTPYSPASLIVPALLLLAWTALVLRPRAWRAEVGTR